MINNNMVFVIGAGGSMSYGFPSGEMLISEIIQLANTYRSDDFFRAYEIDAEYLRIFANQLNDSNTPSIDLYLSNQNEINRKIGKYFIAKIIGSNIMAKPVCTNGDDWYKIVYQKMLTKFENIAENKVSFITFNYDTSLENYIYHSFLNFFHNKNIMTLNEMIRKINFIHIYGSLDTPPWDKKKPQYALIKSNTSFNEIATIAERIKIIDEGNPNIDEVIKAKEILSNANSIYITGFSYNRINIELIGLNNNQLVGKKSIVGNSFGMGKAERSDAGEILQNSNVLIDYNNLKNKEFLKEYVKFA